jgi:hypothetical protein
MLPGGHSHLNYISLLPTDELQTTENHLLSTGQIGPHQRQQNMPHQFRLFPDNDKANNMLEVASVKLCTIHRVGYYFYLQTE